MATAPLDLGLNIGLVADVDRAGGQAWREITKLLWQYLRGDMRDMEAERKRKFPVTWRNHTLKPIPLVRRLALEQAQLYLNAPQRTFDGLSEAQADRMRELYAKISLNEVMLNAHQQVVALNNSTVWVWPTRGGTVRLLLVPPQDQSVELADPTSHDEDDVARWFVRLPVGQDAGTGITSFGTALITPTQAVWTDTAPGDLAGKGLWRDDGSNPLGFIPAVRLRGALPSPGEFFSPANESLLLAQRAVSSDQTSIGVVALMQAHGQAVVKGLPHAAASEIELSPETVIGLSDPDHSFEFAQADPRLDGYRLVVDHYLKMSVAMQGLSPATVLKSSALTALAKRLDNLDRDVERRRAVNECKRAEARILRSVSAWMNAISGVEVFPPSGVQIAYREPVQVVDELHAAQSLKMLVEMGVTSPAEELAAREAISEEAAQDRVRFNLEQRAALAAEAGADGAALNGAQVLAALSVAERVGTGALTLEGGIAFLVEALGVTEDAARRVLAGAKPLEIVA